MDPDPKKQGAFLDIFHGLHLYNEKNLSINHVLQFERSDFIFHTAGIQNVHGEGRLSTTDLNVELTKALFENSDFQNNP